MILPSVTSLGPSQMGSVVVTALETTVPPDSCPSDLPADLPCTPGPHVTPGCPSEAVAV